MTGRPRNVTGADSTLVPMLIWGLVLIVIGMVLVMVFVERVGGFCRPGACRRLVGIAGRHRRDVRCG